MQASFPPLLDLTLDYEAMERISLSYNMSPCQVAQSLLQLFWHRRLFSSFSLCMAIPMGYTGSQETAPLWTAAVPTAPHCQIANADNSTLLIAYNTNWTYWFHQQRFKITSINVSSMPEKQSHKEPEELWRSCTVFHICCHYTWEPILISLDFNRLFPVLSPTILIPNFKRIPIH